jgi:hypothetical protein
MVNGMFNRKPDKGKNWHTALTTPQSVRIRKIHAAIGKELLGFFEHFETRFLEVFHIDPAIADCEKVAQVFTVWKAGHPGADPAQQKAAFKKIIQKTSCPEDIFEREEKGRKE